MRKLLRLVKRFFRKITRKKYVVSLVKTTPYSSVFGIDRGLPIDRFYIENFLKENQSDIKNDVLEIAESTYSKRFGNNQVKYHILHYDNSNSAATLIGDLANPETLPQNICDCFICTQTLNFIYDVKESIKGSYKLLKNGGVFLGTVSGISQISRYDMERWGDYWRFTDLTIRLMFEEVFGKGNVTITIYGNVLAATALLQGLAIEDISNVKRLLEQDEDYQIIIGIRAVKVC